MKALVILAAKKGNGTVVLNKVDYHHEMCDILTDPAYKQVENDSTIYLEKKTRDLILKTPIDDKVKRGLIPVKSLHAHHGSMVYPKFTKLGFHAARL